MDLNLDSPGYGNAGARDGITKSLLHMVELHNLLLQHGVKMSVGVYPWPGQLLYDDEESLQVQIWRNFCINRCSHFYNSFPTFYSLSKKHGSTNVIDNYFIKGDLHHNADGACLIAKDYLSAMSQEENRTPSTALVCPSQID